MSALTRAVVFDAGETLIDETRAWERVSREVGVPSFTFMATFGGLIARGQDHRRVFDVLARDPVAADFTADDFYPDALPCLARLRASGYLVGVVGNTASSVEDVFRPFVDFVGSSARWRTEKPSPAFFQRIIAECGLPASEIAYIGDRVDNDVDPATDAGLQAVQIRRGPWAYLQDPPANAITITNLDELPTALP